MKYIPKKEHVVTSIFERNPNGGKQNKIDFMAVDQKRTTDTELRNRVGFPKNW
jgi:hypothetical protein